jgi:TonB family protein
MCSALRADAQGTLTGHVRESTGVGIAGAEVRIAVGSLRAITDADGAFRIRSVPAAASLTVRRIGFHPATRDFVVSDGATTDVSIVLELLPVQLPQLTVTEREVGLDLPLAGFRDRMKKRSGHFFTREKIESIQPTRFTDIIRGMPGVRIGPVKGTGIRNGVRLRGSSCWPIVFIDGFAAAAAEFDLDTVDPASVEAVEVYMDAASAPTELMGPRGGDRCGVIAIWSRRFHPRAIEQSDRGELQRLLETGAVYSAADVDSAARILPGTLTPAYPDSLWLSATEGYARVEFILDADGAIEWEYFSVVSASKPAFGEAVKSALEDATFAPAIKGGKRVRQVMQVPVRFERPRSPPLR